MDAITPSLNVRALDEQAARAAYALAQAQVEGLDRDVWSRFVERASEPASDRGLLVAENQRGALLALAQWWREPDLRQQTALWAELLVIRELGVRPIVRHAVLDRLRQIAGKARLRVISNECSGQCPSRTEDGS